MKKIWDAIKNFFGFGAPNENDPNELAKLMRWISSKERIDACTQTAFQAIQKNDTVQQEKEHPYEGTILADCLTVDAVLSRHYHELLGKRVGDASYLVASLSNGVNTQLSDASPKNVAQKVGSAIAKNSPEVDRLKVELKDAEKNLHIFKGANNLQQPAIEVAHTNAFYFIGFFAIVEAVANMLFLREAYEPLKGLLIAFAIAGINVGASAYFGSRYREKNHINPERSSKGRTQAVLATIVILLANSAIAFARYQTYSQDRVGGDGNFIFESAVLFAVGVGLGFMAFLKGYSLDDPYPDYGPLSRVVRDLRIRFDLISTQYAEYSTSIKEKANRDHDELKERVISAANSLQSTLPEMSRCLEEWRQQRVQLDQAYSHLQQVFKAVVSANHADGKLYPNEIKKLPSNPDLEHYQQQVEKYAAHKSDLKNDVDQLIKEIDHSHDELHAWVQSEPAMILWRWPK
jgi:hypothetical protein